MRQAIDITIEESENIERLFLKYNSYISMLEYLTNANVSNTEIYEKKWNETAELWIQLDRAKAAAEIKYKPEGSWDRYEFDFNNHQVVFVRDEA